jgi:hypothetical protein
MTAERRFIDITESPELSRIVDELQASGREGVLRRGAEDVALLTPLPATTSTPRRRRRNDSLLRLLAIADSGEARSTGPTDVSANKHKYVAEALAAESLPADDA